MVVIREPETFYFDFYLPKEAWNSIYYIKRNESLAEHKIKNEIETNISYKHGNNIH